jgi:NAD dependent epimerase/dehydratase family enzyme
VNATAPVPVTNATFAQELGRALRRPALLRMPAFVLHRLLGALADELLLGGQRVLPDKADAGGFKFRHETLRSALSAMLGGSAAAPSSYFTSGQLPSDRGRNALSAGMVPEIRK